MCKNTQGANAQLVELAEPSAERRAQHRAQHLADRLLEIGTDLEDCHWVAEALQLSMATTFCGDAHADARAGGVGRVLARLMHDASTRMLDLAESIGIRTGEGQS